MFVVDAREKQRERKRETGREERERWGRVKERGE